MGQFTSGREVAGSDATMSLIQFCKDGDLERVKAALQRGEDVNTKGEYGSTGLMQAVSWKHNSVVALLLNTPNIDVNLKDNTGRCALQSAVHINNNEGVKLLLNVQNIDVNTVDKNGWSAVHRAVFTDNIEALKLLLSHPSLTALTLNQKDNDNGDTPVKFAVSCPPDWITQLEHLEVLAADPRVDLDTTDKKGRSLEKVARDPKTRKVLAEAKQRREEKRRLNRLIRKQQRQVSNAPPSPSCSASAWRLWGRSSGRSWWRTGRSSLNTFVHPFTALLTTRRPDAEILLAEQDGIE